MMLDHLGHHVSAVTLAQAIEATLAEGASLTADLGGDASTSQATDAVLAHIDEQA
jgi:tartrate dehydrogenase/decarboxylase/D-malate dehydrogenase